MPEQLPAYESSDLEYDGRARKRPAGASELTQQIYVLLGEHPEGLTLDQIHEHLAPGWMDTDAYRSYEKFIKGQRRPNPTKRTRPRDIISPLASGDIISLQSKAQRRRISVRLSQMKTNQTAAHLSGSPKRWVQGRRPPRVMVACDVYDHHIAPLRVSARTGQAARATALQVKREQAKALALDVLKDGRFKGRGRQALQACYDALTGR